MGKPGRPKGSTTGKAKSATLNVRLLPEEKELLTRAAKKAGEARLSEWARKTLLVAARGVSGNS
jgi:uncharacterized protein (DUF1778 family)